MSPAERQYQRVADDLRARVGRGEWQVGERLPSRAKLAVEYDVGENVLQRAQEVLITEGLLAGRAGSGTYVRQPVVRRPMLRSRVGAPVSFRAQLGETGEEGSWESSTSTNVPAPPATAARLGIEPGAPTVHTAYEYLIGGQPVLLADSWEPMSVTEGSPVICPEYGPLAGQGVVRRMAAIGVNVERAVERTRPARATAQQAVLLGVSAGDLVTLIERTHLDGDGRAVETADLVIPDSRWEITYELPIVRQES
ncbi:GntR family transcriptional regulator [Kitasatospora sp. NPDC004289]